jgi:peptidoglycan/LPS O-acetylase OafA/YrhL
VQLHGTPGRLAGIFTFSQGASFSGAMSSISVTPKSRKPGTGSGHLPSLDGLRAISILLVMLGHLSGTRNLGTIPGIRIFGDMAHFGVVVFFVISGFLITSLLLHEHEKTGRISLKLFYARRALRIFPASYMFLAVVGALSIWGAVALKKGDLWFGLAYLVNYKLDRSWYIGHLWSLSVEEQFYLLWPFTLSFFGRHRGIPIAIAGILMGPATHALTWVFFRGTPYMDLEIFPKVADSLAAGCLLAMSRQWLEQRETYLKLFRPVWSLLLVAIVLVTNRYQMYTVVSVGGAFLINILLAVLIHRSVYCRDDVFGKLLNWRPVAFVGLLSYSLYLWQQLFLDRYSTAWHTAFPQNLVFAVAAALASYLLLEKPLMKLRSRLRVVSA